MTVPVLKTEALFKRYRLPRSSLFRAPEAVHAVNGIDIDMAPGHSLGLVGESGCGKSTLARLVMALERPSAGRVLVEGQDLAALSPSALRIMRRDFQMVFQDPYGSLDPRHKVGRIVAEPLNALEAEMDTAARHIRVAEAIAAVGLRPADLDKYPHEFSGGQRQRIAIARALVTRPKLIVADEPVSALDVSVQAQVLNLLRDLRSEFGLTYLLISHDLAVVDYVCDEVAVMYLGQIVEQAPAGRLFEAPAHPYTRALIESVPKIGAGRRRGRAALKGSVQAQTAELSGCPFAPRCPRVESRCHGEAPRLREIDNGHMASCHFA